MDCMDWKPTICHLPVEMDTDTDLGLEENMVLPNDEHITDKSTVNFRANQDNPTITGRQFKVVTYMVWPDSLGLFDRRHLEVQEFWTTLLRKTSLPPNITIDHEKIMAAFTAIDCIILGTSNELWKLRLAYVRLARISSLLLSIIASGRRKGRISRGVGKGNASILIDLYMKAQNEQISTELRVQIQRRLRIARRWADLIGGSIFLAVVYSNKAEIAMNFSITNAAIKSISRQLHEACAVFLPQTSLHSNGYLTQDNRTIYDERAHFIEDDIGVLDPYIDIMADDL
ncbi:hypothetical protein GGI35DRAFT_483263 [Trichoderma velutinum]